jgi:hypothetical protein
MQALQSEGDKLEKFHQQLLERNAGLQKQLSLFETTLSEVSDVAPSPSTDTGETSVHFFHNILSLGNYYHTNFEVILKFNYLIA